MNVMPLWVGLCFLLPLSVHAAADPRTPIKVTPEEKAFLHKEMRGFVDALSRMTEALAEADFSAAARAAKQAGLQRQAPVPPALKSRLPQAFKRQGMALHRAFDAWAMDAEAMQDVSLSLKQMGRLMQRCTACHVQFRLETGMLR